MERYIRRKDKAHVKVLDKYVIQGFISSGTYGKVYKACNKIDLLDTREYAIKKFKAEREGESATYSGLSQSACREMSLCRELKHDNIVLLQEIILEEKCIYMIFEFYEYDLLQIIHYHLHQPKAGNKQKIPDCIVRSILHQLLQGVAYLHENWVIHRDLKPANIMITKDGVVKIGDLGLARQYYNPIQPLYSGDKVVVTIWYRAPELLLGSKHYGPAIDLWAVGCIFAELLVLQPLFKGDEVKIENKKTIPFQRQQMTKIIEILGTPSTTTWPNVVNMPEFHQLKTFRSLHFTNQLPAWYRLIGPMASTAQGLKLLMNLLEYDPTSRIAAVGALSHGYFQESPRVTDNVFDHQGVVYPNRQIRVEDADMNRTNGAAARIGSQPASTATATAVGGINGTSTYAAANPSGNQNGLANGNGTGNVIGNGTSGKSKGKAQPYASTSSTTTTTTTTNVTHLATESGTGKGVSGAKSSVAKRAIDAAGPSGPNKRAR